jgi:hypothetical protein
LLREQKIKRYESGGIREENFSRIFLPGANFFLTKMKNILNKDVTSSYLMLFFYEVSTFCAFNQIP